MKRQWLMIDRKGIWRERALATGIMLGVGPVSALDLTRMAGVEWNSARPGFHFKAEQPHAVGEPVILAQEVASVCGFHVADGPAAIDVAFNSGIREAGGSCGIAKEGPGTLKVAGEVRLSGVVTVYDGTLDLSEAKTLGVLDVNLLGNARFVPPADRDAAITLYLNGEKQKPGLWGPPGKTENGTPMLDGMLRVPESGPSRRETWLGLKYGIFSHYVWNGYGMTAGMPNADGSRAATIDDLADRFDVPNYVNQLVDAGAQYVVFTAWHSGTCPLFPSAAMRKWAPGRASCPKRDLLGDLLDECNRRGLRAFFYCHPYQPVAEPHNDWINDLFAELVERYGRRLDGLWIDENFQDCTQDKVVDYRRLVRTIKERNPDLVLTHNNGGFQTYGVDEGVQEVQWEFHQGRMTSSYQIFGQTAKSPEDMLITTVIQAAANRMGGGIQWSIDAHGAGGGNPGGLDAAARPILDGFTRLFKPIAESVRDTRPSASYPPPFRGAVVRLADLPWGVATQSADGRREFLHVLKPPAGDSLTLPPPADGKVFGNARLLEGGQAVAMQQSNRAITLTLPPGTSWRKPDTVIVMDTLAPGGVGLVNNTSVSIAYLGASWIYRRDGMPGEFRRDAHQATSDGDSFAFTFEGTDVEWPGAPHPDGGTVELTLDGVAQGTIDRKSASGIFAKRGLARGKHVLTGIKRGGAAMAVDAFRVSDLINDSDPSMVFSTTTRHGPTAAALEGPWEPRGESWINGQAFTFRFRGTAVQVLGGAAHNSGDLALTLDGKEHPPVHCHGGQQTRLLANLGDLANEAHVLVGRYVNPHPAGFISALDGFVVTRPDYWDYQKQRGLGEIGDDAHFSTIKEATGSLEFNGSGVEVFTTRDSDSRTAHYSLNGGGSSLWVGLNHYAPVTVARSRVFQYPNLVPGTYTVGFTNAANGSGVGFSNVRLSVDAIRIHKGESSSASPLYWGKDARGGSGVWDTAVSDNWHDRSGPAKWQDCGAADHVAVFAGIGGTVELAAPVRLNRLIFRANGYHLRGQGIELTGYRPTIHLGENVRAVVSLTLRKPDGSALAPGTYAASSHPDLIAGGGTLVVEAPR